MKCEKMKEDVTDRSSYENISEEKFLEEVCLSTWRDVYRFIYYKVGNKEEAEDITQETYVRAIKLLQKGYVQIEDYTNYFKTIAINILKDQWRKDKKDKTFVDIDKVESELVIKEDFTDEIERKELVQIAMNNLNEEQKRVIELRILKGFSTAETARVLKKKDVTIRVIQYRALQIMANALKNI